MFAYREFLRSILSWRFAIPVVVSWVLMFWALSTRYPLTSEPPPGFHPFYFNAYDAWRRAIDAFVLFAPIAAALPYADSYLRDRAQGFARYALLRMTHRRYLVSKLSVNGLLGGLAVALPMMLFFAYTSSIYARALPPLSATAYSEGWMRAIGFLGDLFVPHPNLYILARILLGFIFGVTFSTLGMAISPFIPVRYIVLAFPFIFFLVAGFAVNIAGVPALWSAYALIPDGMLYSTATSVLMPLATIFIVSTICIFGCIRKYNDQRLY